MSTKVHGALGEQDESDTYTLWRRPGQCGYVLSVRGEGAVEFRLEVHHPGRQDGPEPRGIWRVIEHRRSVVGGSRAEAPVMIPEVELGTSEKAVWVQLRVRISRAVRSKTVEYDFFLDGIA